MSIPLRQIAKLFRTQFIVKLALVDEPHSSSP
jgi:hypothetical protein